MHLAVLGPFPSLNQRPNLGDARHVTVRTRGRSRRLQVLDVTASSQVLDRWCNSRAATSASTPTGVDGFAPIAGIVYFACKRRECFTRLRG